MKDKITMWLNWRWGGAINMKDKIAMWFAWKLPVRVAHWCAIRVAAYATQGAYSDQEVPALTAMDATGRFAKDHGLY